MTTDPLPDDVMLADFERLLSVPDTWPNTEEASAPMMWELCKFMDEHGARLLLLARTCHQAMIRQGL